MYGVVVQVHIGLGPGSDRYQEPARRSTARGDATHTYLCTLALRWGGLKGSTMAPRPWHQAVPGHWDALCSPIDRHRRSQIGRWRRRSPLRIDTRRAIRIPFTDDRRRPRSSDWIMNDDPPIYPKWTWIWLLDCRRVTRDARIFPHFSSVAFWRPGHVERGSARTAVRARLRRHTVVSESLLPEEIASFLKRISDAHRGAT